MNTKLIGKSLVLSAGLVCMLAAAGQGNDGALLTFKVSSEALPEAGTTKTCREDERFADELRVH